MEKPLFVPAEILLPEGAFEKWAVLACDQFTSQPDYWEETARIVGQAPSTLHIILPEVYLEDADVQARIGAIHSTMGRYIEDGTMRPAANGFVYVERTMCNGTIRQGLVGAVDLDAYSYTPGEHCGIRPTEGTVVERIPPRLAVRRGAALESPHILMLVDDAGQTVIEPLGRKKNGLQSLYDVDLMQEGGRLRGWAVTDAADIAAVQGAITALGDPSRFKALYNTDEPAFTFAVGDGNHSLATAKAYWEEIKQGLTAAEAAAHPARLCLVELSNIQSPANAVEPIHRVVFGADGGFLEEAKAFAAKHGARLGEADGQARAGQSFALVHRTGTKSYTLQDSPKPLAVGSLDAFLADYMAKNPRVNVDYVHGEKAVQALAGEGALGIVLPPLQKSDLFLGVAQGGVLPRKTFSMGHAQEKRYYMECRRITK